MKDFDIIIIGGGSAGSALASRLSQSTTYSICLIEVGGSNNTALVNIPAGMAFTVPRKCKQNFAYHTLPQQYLNNRKGYQPRGRGLGGSSAINAMIYLRGQPEDYNHWRDLGCVGWSFEDVLPYFLKSEFNESGKTQLRAQSPGVLNIANSKANNQFAQAFIEAGVEAGFSYNADFNGVSQEGIGWYQVTQKDGERYSVARAYLSGRNYPNLTILTNTHVRRIIFDTSSSNCPIATGVEVVHSGRNEIINAKRQVVLSAGAFGSPQLLMVSGVGDASELNKLNIHIVHNLPEVGQNLQDHLDFIVDKKLNIKQRFNLFGISLRGALKLFKEYRLYKQQKSGMMTSNVAEAGAFLKTIPEMKTPDIQLHFLVAMVDDHSRKYHLGHGYSCHVCVLRPKSRGSVTIASQDSSVAPIIDPNFLSHSDDLKILVDGVKIVHKIFNQPALTKFGGKYLHREDADLDDQSIINAIRKRADTIYHPVGTCRMGADANAVVDTRLRVNGIANLRVVDASIMPALISGNTNAPTVMIAEKAADMIIEDLLN